MYRKYFKRLLDIFLALGGLVILCPVLLVIAMLVRIKLGSPVLFRQPRPGLNEKIFILYKFRTMNDERDEAGRLLPDSARLNKFGKVLRAASLDELPELLNVLKGDMSMVGPRPLSVLYLPYYNKNEKVRHTVRPGLTGLAQVNGRNAIEWSRRFAYDVKYVNNISLKLDLFILLRTFVVAFGQKNIAQAEEKPVAFHVVRQQEWTNGLN